MSYPCPYKMRAWNGVSMQPVHSLCFNAGGAIWYGAGNSFGWCWVDESFDGWNGDNPKPGKENTTTVMRWSGLQDKNGVDIYEGDIMIIQDFAGGEERTMEVVHGFYEDTDYYGHRVVGFYLRNALSECYFEWANAEVTGNIYQNPELLKS